MAAKRSPILGYNHNVRYRGVVFHVQTEDSGLSNPHVFTHLFHGGVILSTRKLVYDPGASEEAVKALMQSQHKAVLRDLKGGSFDDKIDQYLAGTAGLLPRGVDETGPREKTHDETAAAMSRAPTEVARGEGRAERADDTPVAPTKPARASAPPGQMPPIPARASGTIPVATPGPRVTQPRSAMAPPVVVTRAPGDIPETERREVSQAFKAMVVDDDVAEVHSPAPPSAAVPPGAAPHSPGEYAQHRKRGDSAPMPMGAQAGVTPAPAPATPGPPRRDSAPSQGVHSTQRGAGVVGTGAPKPGDVVRGRPPTPAPRAGTVQGPPAPQRIPGVVSATSAPVVPRNASATARPPGPPQRARPPTGGVVMSKPAIIVGAPPKVVGTHGHAHAPPAPSPAPAPAAPRPGGNNRVRKAREESEGGVFGQDLISEKSLDEVILAYLSEDGSEE